MAEKTDVEKIVEELRAMGYDARLLSGETVTLPFYENYVPCGVPNDVGDVVESTITINSELVGNLSMYVMIAKGDSMIDCGIFDGDYLYVEPRQDVSDGNVVLASIDGEMTVKVFFEDENGDKWLVPQNDDYDPILLNDKLNITIHGRVVHSIHRAKSISFKDCKRRVVQSRKRMNARVSRENMKEAILEVKPLITYSRLWFSVYRVLSDRGIIENDNFTQFTQYLQDVLGEEMPEFDIDDIRRLSVMSFSKPFVFWNKNNSPSPKRFELYCTVYKELNKLI